MVFTFLEDAGSRAHKVLMPNVDREFPPPIRTERRRHIHADSQRPYFLTTLTYGLITVFGSMP